ncbi:histidine kinase [Streptomyces tubbatahanensis]|uniref:histidine kinase n=1 Tax=Streptomyces tubbatahanensis TaxID=2923272 RepID=A0ABY3Y1Z5_9ACTN|nr:histidine kinase [Streptomyces tubbatahanensis]UNT00860.1 histidine kinase [Streptomyces tubbatahanensis]
MPRRTVGVLAGCVTALPGLLYLVLAGVLLGPLLLWPRTRGRAVATFAAGARRLAAVERRRRSLFFADRFPDHRADHRTPRFPDGEAPDFPDGEAPDERIVRYLAARTGAGLLTGVVVALLCVGAVLAALLVAGLARGTLDWLDLAGQCLLGGVLLFLDVQGLRWLDSADARLARACFGPSERDLLRRRIDELAASRAAVLRAVDTERRRIERDLHDGVQQRLVALAMLLGRARREGTPERSGELVHQAHLESQEVLRELREVAWRAYPTALDALGLREALASVTERSGLPVRTDFHLSRPLPASVETAAYFLVSECVTNAAKHAAATGVVVSVRQEEALLLVRVQDDGVGGADPAGSGLTGLRSRVGALDGRLHLHSPSGGPTIVTAELPCA